MRKPIYKYSLFTLQLLLIVLLSAACQNNKQTVTEDEEPQLVGPTFSADSAIAFCAAQCEFGPRTMNSEAHDKCEQWIINRFKLYGADVMTQKADLTGWDGKKLHSTNIIASINPEAKHRIIICAHWDSRPWADNDPDSTNWQKPVMAANDGASGVAVMLELCRIINGKDTANVAQETSGNAMNANVGIDFVCFDAEDYGAPDWAEVENSEATWALGSQYYAAQYANDGTVSAYGKAENIIGGILLDMVGGQGAHFYHEGFSRQYAQSLLEEVWQSASNAGYSAFFLNQQGGKITDDHKSLIDAGIPTIDIIAYYPDCEQSGFGPTWHTVNDDMNHLDKNVLKAVGQSLVQYLYSISLE